MIAAAVVAFQLGLAADTTEPRPISQLVHTTWEAKDGAPTAARALAQTTDGYLWIGTLYGLVRFDGVRFVPLSLPDGQVIPTGGVRRLLATRDGTLWIVWRNGSASRLRGDRLTTYDASTGTPVIRDLTESNSGELVAATESGLFRFVDGKWEDVNQQWGFPGNSSRTVWFDRDNTLWALTQDGLVYRPSGSGKFIDPGMPLSRIVPVYQFAQSRDGTIWMADFQRSAHTVRRAGESGPETEVLVGAWTLQFDRTGSLWIGTGGDGLRRVLNPASIRGKRVAQSDAAAEQFTMKDGLLSDVILALLVDREGNVWVASDKGLERFREGAFTPFSTTWSGRSHVVYAIADTSVWIGAMSAPGFLRIRPPFDRLTPTPDSGFYFNLSQDASGQIWSVVNRRILRLSGDRFKDLPLQPSEPRNLTDIITDRQGTVWVFDHQLGLFRIAQDSLVLVVPLPPASQPATYLLSDRKERIWAAQENRVVLFARGQHQVFPTGQNNGLGSVNGILEDSIGQVWVFGEAGLSRFEENRFRSLPSLQELPGRWIHGVAIDDGGSWWLTTPEGVIRLPPGEIDRAIKDSTHSIRYRLFDRSDGIPGAITPTWRGPLVTRSADGRIWVGTDDGVATADPRQIAAEPSPRVLIEVLRVNGREMSPSTDVIIPSGLRDLEIDFTSTTLSTPERVQFRYRLEGTGPNWHDVGTRRRAYFTGLAPGHYTFRVSARNGDGDWNQADAVLPFSVLPAWYQTIWFRAGVVLLIAAIGATSASLVQRRRHLREQRELNRQFDERLAERMRIARELHDTLLQTVQGSKIVTDDALDRPNDADHLRDAMTRVSGWLGQAIDEGRTALMSLRGASTVTDLSEALRRATETPVKPPTLNIAVDTRGTVQNLHPVVYEEVYRIGQEGIRNACLHSRATRLAIELEYGDNLVLRMTDDGVGVATDVVAGKPGHYGIAGMHERAGDIGATLSVEPVNPGTRITLVVPGRSAFLLSTTS